MSSLVRYQTPTTISSIFDDFLDGSWFSPSVHEFSRSSWPKVDVEEEKDSYRLHADLPGLDKKDINVKVENGVLTISGEKNIVKKDRKKDEYAYYERSYGKFSRSFQLPEHVDENNIKAGYKNGVLDLTIKKTEKARPKQIDIKVD